MPRFQHSTHHETLTTPVYKRRLSVHMSYHMKNKRLHVTTTSSSSESQDDARLCIVEPRWSCINAWKTAFNICSSCSFCKTPRTHGYLSARVQHTTSSNQRCCVPLSRVFGSRHAEGMCVRHNTVVFFAAGGCCWAVCDCPRSIHPVSCAGQQLRLAPRPLERSIAQGPRAQKQHSTLPQQTQTRPRTC